MRPPGPGTTDAENEAYWREYLTHPDSVLWVGRRLLRQLPAEPRCHLCTAPFRGVGGSLMRVVGKRQSTANPHMCTTCEDALIRHHGGAEVDGAMLFADIRGSTSLAERMSTAEFHALLDRFYAVASRAVFDHDGIVDKFVGDELVALFFPNMGGDGYVGRAVDAAVDVLRATGHSDPDGPWVPVGAGVHAGLAWFGAVGDGDHAEITAIGDRVNTTARLAAAASAGEVLVSLEAAGRAGLDPTLERASLELKGKRLPTEVVRLRVAP